MSNGAEYGRNATFEQCCEECSVDFTRLNIANKTIVERLGVALYGWYHIAVSTRKAERIAPYGLQLCHDTLVQQTGIDHSYHIERSGIGYAPTLDHCGRNLQLLGKASCEFATTVNQDFRRG